MPSAGASLSRSGRGRGASSRRQKEEDVNSKLESGWNVGCGRAPLPKYDGLRDSNLRQYFESRHVQNFLHSMGWIDREGRIIDLDKHKSKLSIIEQEFKYAEKAEKWRQREEENMRAMIRVKRQRALEEAKRAERKALIQKERDLRNHLLRAIRTTQGQVDDSKGTQAVQSSTGRVRLPMDDGLDPDDAAQLAEAMEGALQLTEGIENYGVGGGDGTFLTTDEA